MMDTRPDVTIRLMRLEDIQQVGELDKLGFPTPWPLSVYRHEITSNSQSMMLVMERNDVYSVPSTNGTKSFWKPRLLSKPEVPATLTLIGYGGFWHVADEAHISTITIHPEWRGKNLGELLIWTMLRQALRQRANVMTLEVRETNIVAQNLYAKYGFKIVGRRKAYYRDNREDAYIMRLEPMDEQFRKLMMNYGTQLDQSINVIDQIPLTENS